MKVVHFNTHSYGGAAVVARRLHRAGLARGIDSRLVTKYGLPSDTTPRYDFLKNANLRYFMRRQAAHAPVYRIGKYLQQLQQPRSLSGRPAGLEVFSPMNEDASFADCARPYDPDVIHLHWVSGFLDNAAFFEANRARRFVWTLHDMNPLTGGCHHSDGCMGYQTTCVACPQLAGTIDADYASHTLESKARALGSLRDDQMTVVSPSLWMRDMAKQSKLLARFRHVYVENPSFDVAPPPTPRTREALGLPANVKLVVFIADNLRNPRKGFDLLFEAMRRMPHDRPVHFVGVGQRTDAPAGLPVSFVGPVSPQQLAELLSSADALAVPSVAENAPLTIIEAATCGLPVVAFDVGGISEMIDEDSGVLATERTAPALSAALHKVLFERTFSSAVIRAAAQRFAPARVIDKYRAVYEELLAS